MDKKILAMLSVLVLIVNPMTAYADTGNAATPVTYSVNYVVSTDTGFSVTIADGQTSMNFNGDRNTPALIEPTGQNMIGSIPWANIENQGEVNQDFSVRLNLDNPTGILLYIGNVPLTPENMGLAVEVVSTEARSPFAWRNVPSGEIRSLYAGASFTDVADNTYSRTLTIRSTEHQVLTSVEVTPVSANVTTGATQTFTATPKDQFGNPMTEVTVEWSNSPTTVGTINLTTGVFTASTTTTGITTITATATAEGKIVTDTATANVYIPTLDTITVSPSSASVVEGNSQTFTATLKDQFGNPMTEVVDWTSSNNLVGTIDATGLFASVNQGTATITATASGKSGTATVTVTGIPVLTSVEVQPSTASIDAMDDTVQLTATPKDQYGNPISATVTWSSGNDGVATVDSSGLVTKVGTGTVAITATAAAGGVIETGTAIINVN